MQHPPDEVAKGTGKKLEFAGQIPKFTQPEIFFLSTLLTEKSSKEVGMGTRHAVAVGYVSLLQRDLGELNMNMCVLTETRFISI